jgi:hypothetical protein
MCLSARVWNYCFFQRLLLWQLIKKYMRCGCLCSYVPEPDDTLVLDIAYQLYCKFEKYPDALRVALRMDNTQVLKEQGLSSFLYHFTFFSVGVCCSELWQLFLGNELWKWVLRLPLGGGNSMLMSSKGLIAHFGYYCLFGGWAEIKV